MSIRVREARESDVPAVVRLIGELAGESDLSNPLTEAYARECLAFPGSYVLLAEAGGESVGLLSYSIRPDLFHAAPSCQIDELIVREAVRGTGIGSALLAEVMQRAVAAGCIEVSVTTLLDNESAQRLYRAHGLVDEALYLERHLS